MCKKASNFHVLVSKGFHRSVYFQNDFSKNLEYLLTSTNQSAKLRDLKIVFWTLYDYFYSIWHIKPRANGRNIFGWYMLRPIAHPFACYCMLLRVVVSCMPKIWNRSNVKLRTNGRNNSRHCWTNNCCIPVCIESMFSALIFVPIWSSPALWMPRIFSGHLICKWFKQELYLPRLISANILLLRVISRFMHSVFLRHSKQH